MGRSSANTGPTAPRRLTFAASTGRLLLLNPPFLLVHAIQWASPAVEFRMTYATRCTLSRTLLVAVLLALLPLAGLAQPTAGQAVDVPTPEEYFGFRMGTDGHLARWDKIVEYYRMLGTESDRLHVWEMGETTLGNPFLALVFTTADTHAQLDRYRAMNAMLSDPRGVAESQIEDAIANGKAVIVQSLCLHSTEVAAGQTAVELAYDLVTREDTEVTRIMENTIGIMIPCFNPDGQIMITDWVDETRGTEFQGAGLPYLYHHFIGHDNNRDAFMQNTVESQYGAQIMFREWVPQAYVDHHQMGAYTARMSLPPYAEPIRPDGDPLVWREMAWYGAHMAYRMEEADLEGAVNAAIYSGWGHMGFHWLTPFHNIAGMLTEAASARLAWPLYVHPEQLGGSRQLPEYEAQTTFPSPWEGGWWTVRDIVDRQKIAYMATLDIAAKNREMVLRNAYLKAKRQTERGAADEVKAYVIPADQHDRVTMQHMINKLLGQGIEVREAGSDFTHEGRAYSAGTYVVSRAQPKRGVVRWLLGQTFYPDNSYTRRPGGDPIRPYDMSGDVMAEFMGVRVDAVRTPVTAPLTVLAELVDPQGRVLAGTAGYRIDGRQNASFHAVNQLWNEGVGVRRVEQATGEARPGDFLVAASAPAATLSAVAEATGVDFIALDVDATSMSRPVSRLRVGMYQRYYGGNMDEGWTRWLLEDFEFPYTSIFDADLTSGDLAEKYDVIILPADRLNMMTGDREGTGRFRGGNASDYPPQYRSGFGQPGVDALEAFVEAGGTLVAFAEAGDLPIQKFELPVRNITSGVATRDFYSPGSTLRIEVDTSHPLAFGMPANALATFLATNQVYEALPGARSQDVTRIASYVDRDLLQSGWLIGEDVIAGRAAIVSVNHGDGQVVLIGFRAQHRAQAHGTFKFLFNALVSGHDGAIVMATEQGAGAASP